MITDVTLWGAVGTLLASGAAGVTALWKQYSAKESARELREQARIDRLEAQFANERKLHEEHSERMRAQAIEDVRVLTAALIRATDMGNRTSELLEQLAALLEERDSETPIVPTRPKPRGQR